MSKLTDPKIEGGAELHQRTKVEEFVKRHQDRLLKWNVSNPNQSPPVYYLEKEDRVIWLNRAQRRKKRRRA
jgi:hypothetical protein